ncbi:Protein of unknown function [Pyronema omphalodes CBS 100304]|uniref:Uncharacterized protein n=1 Tax=Pyronema omphalodes (strain CBS 100304) TaxID=1076935 RepID=U4L9X7_PYROM|nr:Protein of unknown function [Pyronema omphalodes CBS 100304]
MLVRTWRHRTINKTKIFLPK